MKTAHLTRIGLATIGATALLATGLLSTQSSPAQALTATGRTISADSGTTGHASITLTNLTTPGTLHGGTAADLGDSPTDSFRITTTGLTCPVTETGFDNFQPGLDMFITSPALSASPAYTYPDDQASPANVFTAAGYTAVDQTTIGSAADVNQTTGVISAADDLFNVAENPWESGSIADGFGGSLAAGTYSLGVACEDFSGGGGSVAPNADGSATGAIAWSTMTVNADGSFTVATAPAVSTTTTLSATQDGTTPTTADLSATVSPAAAGTVSFFNGTSTTPLNSSPIAVTAGSASFNAAGLAVGVHSFKAVFTPTDSASFTGSTSAAVALTLPAVNRLSGPDRYGTAVAISQTFAPGVPVVYIATGLNYPDALSAAPAAAKQGGPLLLVAPTSIPSEVSTELARLNPAKIVVVGGTGAVSASVYTQLTAVQPNITRIAGTDRYDTSRLLAQYAFTSATTAYVATGANFPDALSAGPAAAKADGPVILVNGSATTVDAATSSLISGLGISTLNIVGGTGVVSTGVQNSLAAMNGMTVNRYSGAVRDETSGAINRAAFTSAGKVFLAVDSGYADALAGAAAAGNAGDPLYVVPGTCVPSYVLTDIASFGASSVTLLGGTGALSTSVAGLTECPVG